MRERSQRQGRAYAAIPNAALRDTSISMEARGLLALLMTYADDWTFQKGHLMEVTGWGRDKFEKHMRELRDAQYVELVQDRDATGRVFGSTWIIRDEGHRSPEIQGVGDSTEALNFSDTEALKNQHPEKPSPGKSAPLRRTTLKENQKEETQTLFGDLPKQEAKAEKDHFAEFWAAYPKCQRKVDRPKAMALFQRIVTGKHGVIAKTAPEVIIEGLRRYASTNPDPAYIPLPKTWLNGERWTQFQTEAQAEDPEVSAYRARMRRIIEEAEAAKRGGRA